MPNGKARINLQKLLYKMLECAHMTLVAHLKTVNVMPRKLYKSCSKNFKCQLCKNTTFKVIYMYIHICVHISVYTCCAYVYTAPAYTYTFVHTDSLGKVYYSSV